MCANDLSQQNIFEHGDQGGEKKGHGWGERRLTDKQADRYAGRRVFVNCYHTLDAVPHKHFMQNSRHKEVI